jgi:hypothetical protein
MGTGCRRLKCFLRRPAGRFAHAQEDHLSGASR